MKKFWLGVFLLVFLLSASLLNARGMDRNYRHMAGLLTEAADAALAGDLPQGAALAEKALQLWQKHYRTVATVADHQPLETVDGLLFQIRVYAAADQSVDFAATCRSAARQVEAVGDAQALNWWNLL